MPVILKEVIQHWCEEQVRRHGGKQVHLGEDRGVDGGGQDDHSEESGGNQNLRKSAESATFWQSDRNAVPQRQCHPLCRMKCND